jgi:hypothetical protein
MRPSQGSDAKMCPFLRSIRQSRSGQSPDSFANACYLQRRPIRSNLIHALHTQANLCTSANYVICPHYRVAMSAHRSHSRVPARA